MLPACTPLGIPLPASLRPVSFWVQNVVLEQSGAWARAGALARWHAEDGGCRHARSDAAVDEAGISADAVDEAVRRLLRQRAVPHRPGVRRRGGRRYPWAELLRRVFLVDVLLCMRCGGKRRLRWDSGRSGQYPLGFRAAIHDPESIRRVLLAMGLPTEEPVLVPVRGPPAIADWSDGASG